MFDFSIAVDRTGIGNMKYIITPDEIKQAGVVSYSGAEMEFGTAPVIIKAVSDFVSRGLYGFTLNDDKYQTTVSQWMKYQRNFDIEKNWIVPTHGTIFSVATTIRLLTQPGDGVIVSPPVYHRYEQAAMRLGRKTVYNTLINSGGRYSIDFENLELLMSGERNKLYILCNPHNPIGKVWDTDDLERIAEIAGKHGVTVFSDEIFAEVVFNGKKCVPFCAVESTGKSIMSTSLGKTFNFTGVNQANIIIPDQTLRDAFIAQRNADHFGSIDPFFYAAITGAYSKEGAKWKDAMTRHIWECYTMISDFFSKHLPQVIISPLEGSFVIWVDWRAMFPTNAALKDFLQNEALIHADLGSEYGSEVGFTRMCIAVPKKDIMQSLELLIEAIGKKGLVAAYV